MTTATDIKVGDSVTLLGIDPLNNNQAVQSTGYTVTAVDLVGNAIEIFPPVAVDAAHFVVTGVQIAKIKIPSFSNKLAPITISAIDVSPMMAGQQLGPGDRRPTDPVQVDPSETNYNAYNQDDARRLDNVFSVPSIPMLSDPELKSRSIAAIRILPVTEDNLTAQITSEELAALWINTPISDADRARIDSQQNAYKKATANNPPSTGGT